MITVGSILGGTMRFVRANPGPIAVWTLLNFLVTAAMRLAIAPIYADRVQAMQSGGPAALPWFGPFVLIWLVMMFVMIVLFAAVFRAVLFPDERRFAYLRVGRDELRLLGLLLLLAVGMMIVWIVAVVIAIAFGAAIGMLLGSGQGGLGIAMLAIILPLWLALLYVAVRLSLAQPLTIARRQIVIGPAWRLTRGRFWTLFGSYFVMGIGFTVVSLILFLPTLRPMLDAMGHPGDPMAQQRLAELQARQVALGGSPLDMLALVVNGLIGGVLVAILAGLPAVATAQLLDEAEGRL